MTDMVLVPHLVLWNCQTMRLFSVRLKAERQLLQTAYCQQLRKHVAYLDHSLYLHSLLQYFPHSIHSYHISIFVYNFAQFCTNMSSLMAMLASSNRERQNVKRIMIFKSVRSEVLSIINVMSLMSALSFPADHFIHLSRLSVNHVLKPL